MSISIGSSFGATKVIDTSSGRTGDIINELRDLKRELIKNTHAIEVKKEALSVRNSPYLHDHVEFNPQIRYNSPDETSWKKISTPEENYQQSLTQETLRKLNII